MALICRRNNRTQTCYEWLSIYFAKQDAADFSEGSFAYIDAYANGIRAQKLESAMANKRILYILGAAVLAVLAVCLFVGHGLVGFVPLVGIGYFVYCILTEKNRIQKNVTSVNLKYDQMITDGKDVIRNSLNDWQKAKSVVVEFEQKPVKEIIA